MLLEALVACAGVTMKAVATALDIPLKWASVSAEGNLDFRGTLGVAKEARSACANPAALRSRHRRIEGQARSASQAHRALLRGLSNDQERTSGRHKTFARLAADDLLCTVATCAGFDGVVMCAAPDPPDLYFALTLIVKMAITAAFVLAATITAERAGPRSAGWWRRCRSGRAGLRISCARSRRTIHLAKRSGESAVNAANVIFAVVYCVLAQRRSLATVWAAPMSCGLCSRRS